MEMPLMEFSVAAGLPNWCSGVVSREPYLRGYWFRVRVRVRTVDHGTMLKHEFPTCFVTVLLSFPSIQNI